MFAPRTTSSIPTSRPPLLYFSSSSRRSMRGCDLRSQSSAQAPGYSRESSRYRDGPVVRGSRPSAPVFSVGSCRSYGIATAPMQPQRMSLSISWSALARRISSRRCTRTPRLAQPRREGWSYDKISHMSEWIDAHVIQNILN